MPKQVYIDQIVASLVKDGINRAERLKFETIEKIVQVASEKEVAARAALSESLGCIEKVRDFASNPENILGNIKTKHGEIAEQIEVQIRRGRDILQHIKPSATFDGVGRTAPEDYIIGDDLVQSKFINGANKSLSHVLEHLKKYPGFSDKGFYHIPKDQFEILHRINSGEDVSELSSKTVQACRKAIQNIETETGKSFEEVVKPSISNYDDVQLGKVDETLDNYDKEFNDTNQREVDGIRQQKRNDEATAQHITDPSWGEALKYSAISAGIAGGVNASIKIYSKIKGGKKITSFTIEDWKEVGFDFGKGAVKGGISGAGIYLLTKVAGVQAPLAGAVVSTAVGLSTLYYDYKKGNIALSDFADAACALSVEAGISAIGAALGQAVIPIPVLGAIVGSAAAKASLEITKKIVGEKEGIFIKDLQEDYNKLVSKLDAECKSYIDKITEYFEKLGGLINAALDPDVNIAFFGSIQLCQFLEVPENQIIHSTSELDDFMQS